MAHIQEAVAALSAVCDGAHAEDGQGFNQADSPLGRTLARIPAEAWTADMEAVAYDMVRKYRGQLDSMGFDFDAFPKPKGEAVKRERRQVAKAVVVEGGRFVIDFPYNPALVSAVKAIPGRRFDAQRKVWTAPLSAKADVQRFAAEHGFGLAGVDEVEAPETPAAVETKPARRVEVEGRTFVFHSEYDPALVAAFRDLPGRRWDAQRKVNTAGADAALSVDRFAREHGFKLSDEAESIIGEARERVEASKAEDATLDQRAALELRPYQKAGVKYVTDHANGRAIIGDEMGLGKTPMAIETILQAEVNTHEPAVIIVPPSLRPNWRREFVKFAPDLTTHVIEGKTIYDLPEADVYIIGYSTIYAWAEHLPVPKVMVCDESHNLSNSNMKKVK